MKNKLKVGVLLCLALTTTGCGSSKYLTDDNNKVIISDVTGQQLRKDILCTPAEDTEIYEIYLENEDQLDVKLDDLPTCNSFKVTSNESASFWDFVFVKPTAFAITSIGKVVLNLGIAVILVGILIRLILLPLQIKTTKQTRNMRLAAPDLKKIEKKYAGKTEPETQMMKSQEMMAVYKKYGINPLAGCLPALIQLPIFFAFLSAIYRIPSIYEQSLLGFNLGMTPSHGIQNGEYQYLLLMVLIGLSTYFSFKHTMKQNPQTNDDAAKQMKTMLNFMTISILVSSLFFPSALHFYWIVTYAFIAIQTEVINRCLGDKKEKKSISTKKENTNIKEKLEKKERKNGKTK